MLLNVEIDPKINAMYVKNHQPKFNYCMDLRDLINHEGASEELFQKILAISLDIWMVFAQRLMAGRIHNKKSI